eukprot:COSAG01_NODE_35298_length_534_cov_0.636782_2_plen_47_part_01
MTIDHSLFLHNEAVSSAFASELLDSVCVHGVRARACDGADAWVRLRA